MVWTLLSAFLFVVFNIMALHVLTKAEKNEIAKHFVEDMESFSAKHDKGSELFPVVCCVCDSIPHHCQWHTFIDLKDASNMFHQCNLTKQYLLDEYPDKDDLLNQYSASDSRLTEFVLSPDTFVNEEDKVLICKNCARELNSNRLRRLMPREAIANNYVIGHPPDILNELNEIELSIISIARVYAQSFVFSGGPHRHIQGWHIFYKNRLAETVGNLMQLNNAGMKGSIVVVLAGPFTSTQKALTMTRTIVDPNKIVYAYRWMIANNIKYEKKKVPHIDELPMPKVLFNAL
jgi:hypothetical protein